MKGKNKKMKVIKDLITPTEYYKICPYSVQATKVEIHFVNDEYDQKEIKEKFYHYLVNQQITQKIPLNRNNLKENASIVILVQSKDFEKNYENLSELLYFLYQYLSSE